MNTSQRTQLDAIGQLPQAAKRGRALEQFVADLFRHHHFKVTLNAGIARPRQTDVLATKVAEVYLIECKWRSDKANIDDIDSLRSRLRRTERSVVGILVSVPGFTGSALFDVEQHREQPILLISGDELRTESESLTQLLWRKKEALLTDGKVLLDEPIRKRARRRPVALPRAERQFLSPAGQRRMIIEFAGEFGKFVFAHELPDIDWVPAPGLGVALDVAPRVMDQRELLDLIEKLADLGWATADARWSIQQSMRNWHGLGSAAFAEELPCWEPRASTSNAHHSEEICYLDRCDGGFYTLTATLSAHKTRRTTMTNISFQLQGVPLDTGPLLQLCRAVGVHDSLYFRPRGEKSVGRYLGRPLVHVVQPIGLITASEHSRDFPFADWVTGVIINNPFHRACSEERNDNLPEALRMLKNSARLVCDLAEHHPLDNQHYAYHLWGFEYAWTTDAMVCRPIANWALTDLALRVPSNHQAQPSRMPVLHEDTVAVDALYTQREWGGRADAP